MNNVKAIEQVETMIGVPPSWQNQLEELIERILDAAEERPWKIYQVLDRVPLHIARTKSIPYKEAYEFSLQATLQIVVDMHDDNLSLEKMRKILRRNLEPLLR